MRRRLSGWGWAAVGALAVILLAWLATTVYTAVEEHNDHVTITHIERVVGLGGAHRVTSEPHTPAVGHADRGGGASNPSTGHSQPAPGDGGGGSSEVAPSAGGHKKSPEKLPPPAGGHEAASAPPAPTPSTSSQQSSSSTTTTEVVHEATPSPTEPAPVAPVRSAVGGVVEEAGTSVTGAVEGLTGTTCEAAKVLCP